MNKKVILMILDGWGISSNPKVSAIDNAKTPFMDSLYKTYPHATLLTYGMHVGLPDGQMGNSEVGHMNIGAGRIVYQDLAKINLAVKNNTLGAEKVLIEGFDYAKNNNKNLHLLGLLSTGGVHSHISHLEALVNAAEGHGLENIYIHAFTDGRDVDPKSGKGFVSGLQHFLKSKKTKLATIIGRYYAMDRDKRWERVKLAYDLLANLKGEVFKDPVEGLQSMYDNGVTDEFIKPIVLEGAKAIKPGDVVIFFNFRTDRGRELTYALSQDSGLSEYGIHPIDLYYITMTNYDHTFKNTRVIYDKDDVKDTLGEVLFKAGKNQIRIAETEKYPHVTFFFNGGREEPFAKEKRILCPSPKVATYDLKPEMSAYDIRDAIIPELKKQEVDFVCLNFANPDMVGHTGVMQAAIKACETVDECVKDVVTTAIDNGYSCIIIADHGNCDTMINPDETPNTAHTKNLVPIIVVDKDVKTVNNGVLGDIAPTILKLMGLPKPEVMDRNALI